MNRTAVSSTDASIIRHVTWYGIMTNILLALTKVFVGTIGKSHAVIADGVHSFSDLITDVAILLGVRFWTAPADENHPYGHWRIESIVTIVIGIFLAIAGIGIGYTSIASLRSRPITCTGWIAVIGPAISIIAKEVLYRYTVRAGHRIHSSALIANAWHHRSDVFSSLPVLVAASLAAFDPRWGFVDHIGALIVCLFILKISWDIIVPALQDVTDHRASLRAFVHINRIAHMIPGVENVHRIRTRKLGNHIAVDLHIMVDADLTVKQGHAIAEQVSLALRSQGPSVVDVVVHVEPFEKSHTDEIA